MEQGNEGIKEMKIINEYRSVKAPEIIGGGYWRLNSLDKLKVLCAFLIVCIHAPFPEVVGEFFTALTRIAVPIFFMISGFFYSTTSGARQIKKLFRLVVMGNGIYFVWKLALAAVKGEISSFLTTTFTVRNIAKFILLNESHLQSHLWYLGAILYVVVIVTMLFKLNEAKGREELYRITPFLLLGDLILGKYSLLLLHREFPYILVRNWLFVGLPYFSIGMWVKERAKNVEKWKLVGLIVLTAFTTLLERYLLVINNLNSTRDHYLSTTFLAVVVFLFFLSYVGNMDNLVSRIGKRDSTWIYVLHPIVITIIGAVAKKMGVESIYNIVRPIIVFLATAVVVADCHRNGPAGP